MFRAWRQRGFLTRSEVEALPSTTYPGAARPQTGRVDTRQSAGTEICALPFATGAHPLGVAAVSVRGTGPRGPSGLTPAGSGDNSVSGRTITPATATALTAAAVHPPRTPARPIRRSPPPTRLPGPPP